MIIFAKGYFGCHSVKHDNPFREQTKEHPAVWLLFSHGPNSIPDCMWTICSGCAPELNRKLWPESLLPLIQPLLCSEEEKIHVEILCHAFASI